MRLVLFCSGSPLSLAILEAVRARHEIVAIVVPRSGPTKELSASGIPLVDFDSTQNLSADLFCIASFPHLIGRELLAVPRLGTLNVHPSLLPRHRGPDPLFWAYFHDDRETGATIHWVDERVDAGDVVMQVRMPIERGRAVTDLYAELAQLAARGLADAIDAIERGTAARVPQDEAQASHEPRPTSDQFSVDLQTWSAERLWHFVSGIGCRRIDLIRDKGGKVLLHGAALRFGSDTSESPGTIRKTKDGYRIHCADGWVDVARASFRQRLGYRLRRIASSLFHGR